MRGGNLFDIIERRSRSDILSETHECEENEGMRRNKNRLFTISMNPRLKNLGVYLDRSSTQYLIKRKI